MKKIFFAWLQSARHAFSLSFYRALFSAIKALSLCIATSLIVFAAVAVLSCMEYSYVSHFLQMLLLLMPPCVAMLASPLYAPFLVRGMSRIEKEISFSWVSSLWWSLGMYGVLCALVCGSYWLLHEGSVAHILGAGVVLGFVAPFILYKALYFPVATVAMLFKPMSGASMKQLWLHARRMTWYELPFLMWLFVMLLPFSVAVFFVLGWCVKSTLITPYAATVLLHGTNMLCWEIGWIAFMVFYQQRKQFYL